jgi:HSP90 family molecular chaperone
MRNLVQNMEHNNTELVDNAINQLYEGALLIEGYMKNPAEFVQRMNLFIEKATENLK